MPKKLSQDEFIKKIANINSDIESIGEYVGADKKTLFKCKKCGHEWPTTPNKIYKGSGCPKCAGVIRKTHDEFIAEVKNVNPDVIVIGKYINAKTPLKCVCSTCGNSFHMSPTHILAGERCSRCSGVHQYTTFEYIQEINHINPDIEILGEYINATEPIATKCKICGHEWNPRASYLMRGNGCPLCRSSKGEKRIQRFLDTYFIEYVQQYKFDDCRDKKPLPFDFYLPKYNICIEFDGKQHFYIARESIIGYGRAFINLWKVQQHDNIKTDYCIKNHIPLIRIHYTEYDKIDNILTKLLL